MSSTNEFFVRPQSRTCGYFARFQIVRHADVKVIKSDLTHDECGPILDRLNRPQLKGPQQQLNREPAMAGM